MPKHKPNPPEPAPPILFGPVDRHNFGDLLFAPIGARLTKRPVVFAGLAAHEPSDWGDHQVRAISDLAEGRGVIPPPTCSKSAARS